MKADFHVRSQRINEKERLKKEQMRSNCIKRYIRLHDEVFSPEEEKCLAPSFLEAFSKGTPEALLSILKEETKGVYSFDMLKPDYCQ